MQRGKEARLLEREAELATVDELLEAAAEGRGSTCLVEGLAGIGKSTLLAEAGDRAAGAGFEVLTASGHEAESDFAFGVCLQLFERVVDSGDHRERLTSGAASLALPLLAPGTDEPAPASPDPFTIIHGLYWLTANLAERAPLLLAVDDAHWADEPSLRFLRYLAVRIDELPAVALAGRRPGEPGPGIEHLDSLAREQGSRALRLGPLSESAVGVLVRSQVTGAAAGFCRACARATGGNPLYVRELVGAIRDAGMGGAADEAPRIDELRPNAVEASVVTRVEARGEEAVGLARALAVAGDGGPLRRSAELASLELPAAAKAADALAQAGIVDAGEPLRFTHPIVQAAVLADVPPAARARAHADAARLLHGEGADPELVAAQLLRSGGLGEGWTIDELRRAARRARDRGAPAAAARYLRRSLEEGPDRELRAELLSECGLAATLAGEDDALPLLEEAIDLATDRGQSAGTLATAGEALLEQGRLQEAAGAFERGREELAASGVQEPALEAQLWAGRAIAARFGVLGEGDFEERDRPPPTVDEPRSASERALLAFVAVERALAGDTPCSEVREIALRALGDTRLFVEEEGEGASVFVLYALTLCEEHDVVIGVLQDTLQVARRRGSVFTYANVSQGLATCHYRCGRLAEAVADATAACEAGRYGWELYQPIARAILSEAQLDRGEPEAAAQALDVADAEERWGGGSPWFYFVAARARLALAQGRPSEALEGFLDCDRMSQEVGQRNPAIYPWRSLAAQAALRVGEREQALRLAGEELADARTWGAPAPTGVALRALALVEGGDRGVELLREAVTELERSTARLDHARALVDLGGALRRAGQRRDARPPLREGLDLARRCGARSLASHANEELRAAGARPRRLELSGVEALTPMERRTAGLAAEGLSNREVAESLFLTVRTVEMHLTNAYRKLGISSRRELKGALEG